MRLNGNGDSAIGRPCNASWWLSQHTYVSDSENGTIGPPIGGGSAGGGMGGGSIGTPDNATAVRRRDLTLPAHRPIRSPVRPLACDINKNQHDFQMAIKLGHRTCLNKLNTPNTCVQP